MAFGEYTVKSGAGGEKVKVQVNASIGVAEAQPGQTAHEIIEQADAAMYKDKKLSRKGAHA